MFKNDRYYLRTKRDVFFDMSSYRDDKLLIHPYKKEKIQSTDILHSLKFSVHAIRLKISALNSSYSGNTFTRTLL